MSETLGVCARLSVVAAVVWVSSAVVWFFFCGRELRVLTLSDPGRLSARAALFPKGELEHALRPHFAVQHLVSGRVGPEHALLPSYRENTLTTGLSPLEFLESHTQSGLTHGVTCVRPLQAASRTCLLTLAEAWT